MKKQNIIRCVICVMICSYLIIYCLPGYLIKSYIINDQIAEMEIVKTKNNDSAIEKRLTISKENKNNIIDLINDTVFIAKYSEFFNTADKDRFYIYGYDENSDTILMLKSFGGEYLHFYWTPYNTESIESFFIIKNNSWKDTLNSIIFDE